MKKELFIILIVILVLSLVGNFYYGGDETSRYILKKMEENLFACEIIKYENNDVWMLCNGRPFYANFDGTNLEYSLNGWSFLGADNILGELKNCEFYKSERNYDNIDLLFYCNILSRTPTLKTLRFNINNLKITENREEQFLPIFFKDLKKHYPSLKDCIALEIDNLVFSVGEIFKIDLDCRGIKKMIYIKPGYMFPLIEREGIPSNVERAEYVFNQHIQEYCSINNIDVDEKNENHISINSICQQLPFDVSAQYFFPPYSYIWTYNLTKREDNIEEYVIKNLLDKFIVNSPEPTNFKLISFYQTDFPVHDVKVYTVGDETVKFFEKEGKIILIESVCNKLVCIE